MAAKKKAPPKTILDANSSAKLFTVRPTKKQVLSEVETFFDHLQEGEVEAAGASIAHAGKDWWPHQVRSLWQDLVGPWLEEQGEDWDLNDDKSWRDLSWLEKIGVDLDTDWNGTDDDFFLNVLYDGEVTDVSAEFSVVELEEGWVVRRDIIHVN